MRKQATVLGLAFLAISLAGCGYFERETAKAFGYSRMCVEGVSYLQFTSGASVEYNKDGSVKTCM